ncbi:MAG: hypothetical protein ACRDRX_01940 [Pseudonocardiaceae bacterium]
MLTFDTVRPIAALITTYDRVDDARANMEVIRSNWSRLGGFPDVVIVHAYNGSPDWYPRPEHEDMLITVPPARSHFTGAAELIDRGLAAVSREFPTVRYVVCLSADCWIYDPRWLCQTVDGMQAAQHRLAAASWEISESIHGLRRHRHPGLLPAAGLSTDFFVLDLPWATQFGMVPLSFEEFLRNYESLLNYFQEIPLLERYFEGKFLAAMRNQLLDAAGRKDPWGSEGPRQARQALRLLEERRIDSSGLSSPSHKGHWPELGLITAEDPDVKRSVVLQIDNLSGPTIERLRSQSDTSWFNSRQVL